MNKLKLSIVFTMLFCVVFTHAQSSGGNGTPTNDDESIEYTILDSSGGNSNELASNLFDGNPSTKWCSVSFTNKQEGATVGGAFVIFKTSLPMVPTHYTMTTAGDTNWYPQRNWKQWQLYGMNADSDEDVTRTSGNWVPLDKKYNVGTDQLPATNNTSVEFSLSEENSTAFKYFKIEIDEIVSGGTMQMADFLLSGIFTYIPFSDANVKSICVSNWDTDGDGKLSFGEVTAVTTLGEVFKNNNSITSFQELEYFTGLSSIDDHAFNGCSSLTSITFPKSLTSIGNYALNGCTSLTRITLPKNVTSIGNYAFNGCSNITSITLPEKLTSIGQSAFGSWKGLTTITIPESVTSIGEDAFNGCSGLISVKVDNPTPVAITQNTFSHRTNAILIVPAGSGTAYLAADYWKDFYEIVDMGQSIIFADANVKAICVSKWDTDGDGELSYAEAASVTSLGNVFKNNTSIKSFDELKYFIGMTTIGYWAFYGCTSLSSITIPNSVTTIEDNAFTGCSSLSSITIPETVTSISPIAFDNLTPSFNWNSSSKTLSITANKCATIYYSLDGSEPTVNSTLYTEPIPINRNLKVKAIAVILGRVKSDIASYTITDVDSKFFVRDYGLYFRLVDNTTEDVVEVTYSDNYTGDITIPSSVEQDGTTYSVIRIGNNAFGSRPITSVVLPNTIESIGQSAFYGCNQLTSINIPSNVKIIDNNAFYNCRMLPQIDIPNSVVQIGNSAFYNCSAIRNLQLPESLTDIGSEAFRGCTSLSSITLPSTITTISNSLFLGTGLVSIEIPSSVRTIQYSAFYNCSQLTSVKIPEGVEKIERQAFYDCNALTSLVLPSTLTTMEYYAFYNCSSLPTVTLPENLSTMGSGIFEKCSLLTSVYCLATTPPAMPDGHAFKGLTSQATLFVNANVVDTYKKANYWAEFSNISSFDQTPCAQPTFYFSDYALTMSSLTQGATIYYTTDGSEPTTNSTPYTAPIPFTKNGTVRAIAVCDGYANSVISVFDKKDLKVSTPLATISEDHIVTLTCPDIRNDIEGFPETKFYYTVNRDSWQYNNNEWQLYEGPIQLTEASWVHAIAKRDGWNDSDQQSFDYYTGNVKDDITFTIDNIKYKHDGKSFLNEVIVSGHSFKGENGTIDIVIPEQVTNEGITYTITGIGSSAFRGLSATRSVKLPSTVKSIANQAFYNNYNLEEFEFNEGLEIIESNAFYYNYCLHTIHLPTTLKTIGNYAFNYCGHIGSDNNQMIIIPANVTNIGNGAFQNCSKVTSVFCYATNLPETNNGNPFTGTADHATLYVPASSLSNYQQADYWKEFAAIQDFEILPCEAPTFNYSNYKLTMSSRTKGAAIYYTRDNTDPTIESLRYDGPIPFMQNDTIRAIAVLEGYDNSIVREFRKSDFKVSSPVVTISEDHVVTLTCPDIPNDIEGFPETKFYYTVNRDSWQYNNNEWQLYEGPILLTEANWVHAIAKRDGWNDSDQQSFDYYTGNVKDDITFTIDNIKYKHDGKSFLNEVIVSGHLFKGENGTIDIVIPEQVTNEGVSYTVTGIGSSAFSGLSATRSVKLPSTVKSIDNQAFYDNYFLEEFEFNEGLETIGSHVFGYNYRLHTIHLPTTLKTIGNIAFNSCGRNSSEDNQMIIIPANVTKIGSGSFQDCSKVTSVFCYATNLPETNDGDPFKGTADHATLYVPASSLSNYQQADYWKEFAAIQDFEILPCEAPTFNYSDYKLTISSRTKGATIYYTRDNTDPTTESLRYDGPIPFMQNDTIRAIAVLTGYDNSIVREFRKNDFKVAAIEPTISEDHVVTLTCPDIPNDIEGFPETQIYYTVNRSSWQWNSDNSEWQLYEGPIQLTGASWIHVIAKRNGWNDLDQQNIDYYNGYAKDDLTFTIDNIKYTHDGKSFINEVSVSGHTFESENGTIDIDIPETVSNEGVNYTVTSISDRAFYNCSSLSSVTIPSSVTRIGGSAFYYCNNLNDVIVIVRDYSEFCHNIILSSLNYPIQLIDSEGDEITEYIIPDGVTTIGVYAFRNCSGLTDITIPNSVTTIGDYAFQGCSGLTSVSIPKGVTVIGEQSFSDCSNLASVKFGKNVSSIGEYAFRSCSSLTSITLPDILETISTGAFQYTGLTSVSIPDNVKTIGNYAFYNCNNLASINLEDGITSIGSSAFYDCALTSITIPNSVTSIGESAFGSNNNLTTAILGDGVTEIANRTFSYCYNLSSVIIPDGVSSIGEEAFYNCYKLASIKLPESLTTMKNDVFKYCRELKSIELPNSFTVIPDNLFQTNNFQYIKLGNKVKSIGKNAFGSKEPVIEISTATPPKIDETTFSNVEYLADLTVIVPNTKAENAYRKANVWKEMTFSNLNNYAEVTVDTPGDLSWELFEECDMQAAKVVSLKVNGTINADDFNQMLVNMKSLLRLDLSECNITEIPDYALKGKTQLQELTLPSKLQTIGKSAFQDCPYLTGELNLPSTVATIGESAFVGTTYTSVKLPSVLKAIGSYAFNGLPIQQRLVLPSKVTSVGNYAFAGTKITELVIPEGVKSIGDYAFAESPIQGHVTIPDGVTSLGRGAFRNTQISTVFLPNSIETLSEGLFQGCKNLDLVYVPDNYTGLASYAFDDCGALQILRLSANLASMGQYALQSTPLEYLKVPSQVETLSTGVLKNCTKLESVSLPASLKTVEGEAFYGCTALRNLSVEAIDPPAIKDRSAIRGINTDLCLISIPTQSYRKYVLAEYWGQFVQMRNDIAVETEGDGEIAFESVAEDEDEEEEEEVQAAPRRAAARAGRRGQQLASGEETMTYANNGSSVYIPKQGKVRFYIIPAEGEEILSATLDGEDIMPYIVDGVYTATADKKNAKLVVKFSGTGQGNAVLAGDVNGDGDVDIADAVCIVNHVVSKPNATFVTEAADANKDGDIDIADAVHIVNYVVGKINALAPKFEFTLPEPQ